MRAILLILLGMLVADAGGFGFDDVARRAQQAAAVAYRHPDKGLPKALAELNYDQYRDIRYRPERQLWSGTKIPFAIAFFPTGSHFEQPVRINEVDAGGTVREIAFDPALFTFGGNHIDPAALREAGFAGLRVHYPINTDRYKDEVVVFLGASFFRGVGREQLYGASARGLAIDTAATSGEEFPRFVEFWLERPAAGARQLTIYALLDSPRASGAYQFTVRPGAATEIAVRARLILRDNKVATLGLAPLSSMFYFGENQRPPHEDFRPEVHDSDGLAIRTATDEWIFRPLTNPKRLLVSSFQLTDPAGFGLTQRDRNFANYEDLEARYERRPTVWIEPAHRWGSGRVELVQLPTAGETNDNIIAYWVPAVLPGANVPYDFSYRMYWQREPETRPPHAWVSQSRRGLGYVADGNGQLGFAVDFTGPALRRLAPDATVEAVVSSDDNGKIVAQHVERNALTGGQRVVLRLRRNNAEKPVELRLALRSAGQPVSETWSYLLPPEK